MHATERERAITDILKTRGFIAFRDLETLIDASPATLRRDLERMAVEGRLVRVHGGARLADSKPDEAQHLSGPPFHVNVTVNRLQKEAIGRAAAGLCTPGEGVMINGGSTTLQMCDHLDGLNLQVLTNSLHIVSALAHQAGTRILVPGGALFKEQNIILSTRGEDNMPRFHAPKLFLGAASVGAGGVMEPDPVLTAGSSSGPRRSSSWSTARSSRACPATWSATSRRSTWWSPTPAWTTSTPRRWRRRAFACWSPSGRGCLA